MQSWHFEGRAAEEMFRQEQREQEDREKKRGEKDKPFGLLARMKATGWEPGQQLPVVDAIEADHTIETFTIPIAKPLEWLARPLVGVIRAQWLGRFAGRETAYIGTKLEYIFGNATGSAHNIERSTGMLRQLESVGIFDNPTGRNLLHSHLSEAFRGSTKIIQTNGRHLRESILMGPSGGLKVESIWEKNKLITIKLLGGKL